MSEVYDKFNDLIMEYSLPFYLASDSLILKQHIYSKFNIIDIFIYTDLVKTDHSYVYNRRIELNTILDIEILSKAIDLILTSRSTYSTTIYLKNVNCKNQKCKFISPFIRNHDIIQKKKNGI